MEKRDKNIITVFGIAIVTVLVLYILPLIPNFLKDKPDILNSPKFFIVFIVFNIIFIGIPSGIHWIYVRDYSKIKNIWFFALFGGITGALLGEGGNLVMIIPYTILMFFYGFLYKKFDWWKVALTSYLGGIVVENVINRSPLQAPTLTWVAFFTYPYFVTKIFENRKEIKINKILNEFKFIILFSVLFGFGGFYFSRNNVSPPLIILGIALPFVVYLTYRVFKKRKSY